MKFILIKFIFVKILTIILMFLLLKTTEVRPAARHIDKRTKITIQYSSENRSIQEDAVNADRIEKRQTARVVVCVT